MVHIMTIYNTRERELDAVFIWTIIDVCYAVTNLMCAMRLPTSSKRGGEYVLVPPSLVTQWLLCI